MIARTAWDGPRAAGLGGWAVILAALILGSAPSGAVAAAASESATDGAVPAVNVAIQAPRGGVRYRAATPVALFGGSAVTSTVAGPVTLAWTVLRHDGARVQQVAEATGTDASFVPAPDSALTTTYEIRLTALAASGEAATAVTVIHNAGGPSSANGMQAVSNSLVGRSAAFGIAGAAQFSGPIVKLNAGGARSGTVAGLGAGLRIQAALRRGSRASGCRWWSPAAAHFVAGACSAPRFTTATLVRHGLGHADWTLAGMPAGAGTLMLRIVDRHGRPVALRRG